MNLRPVAMLPSLNVTFDRSTDFLSGMASVIRLSKSSTSIDISPFFARSASSIMSWGMADFPKAFCIVIAISSMARLATRSGVSPSEAQEALPPEDSPSGAQKSLPPEDSPPKSQESLLSENSSPESLAPATSSAEETSPLPFSTATSSAETVVSRSADSFARLAV